MEIFPTDILFVLRLILVLNCINLAVVDRPLACLALLSILIYNPLSPFVKGE